MSLRCLALALLTTAAQAHDTWFDTTPLPRAGALQLALGTGERFPTQGFTVPPSALRHHGCRHADGPSRPLHVLRQGGTALQLRVQAADGARRGQSAAITCWAQLVPLDIEIDDRKVQVYLDEIAAPPQVRQRWQALHQRGLPWRERYTKHARVEWRDPRLGGGDAPPARPAPLGMDIVPERGAGALRSGDTLRFTVLRDGQPLAGQAIELRSDRSPVGLWLRTDPQGRAQVPLPFAGRWLLRGTDLRPEGDDGWDSRFVTLTFDVSPRS